MLPHRNSRSFFVVLLFFSAAQLHSLAGISAAEPVIPSLSESYTGEVSPFLALPAESMYWSESNCCGLVAAYVVAHDLGTPEGLNALSKRLPVTAAGTSMLSLKELFPQIGLDSASFKLNSGQLAALLHDHPHVRAIALVQPMHWVAVLSTDEEAFGVFWYPSMQRITQNRMQQLLTGPVLVVGRQSDIRAVVNGTGQGVGSVEFLLQVMPLLQVLLAWIAMSRLRRGWRISSTAPDVTLRRPRNGEQADGSGKRQS